MKRVLTTNFAAVGVLCSRTGLSSLAWLLRVPTGTDPPLGQSGTQGTPYGMLEIAAV